MPRIPYRDYETIDDPEIVEILDRARRVGTPLTSGQQRWNKTLAIGHREYLADTEAGLGAAPS